MLVVAPTPVPTHSGIRKREAQCPSSVQKCRLAFIVMIPVQTPAAAASPSCSSRSPALQVFPSLMSSSMLPAETTLTMCMSSLGGVDRRRTTGTDGYPRFPSSSASPEPTLMDQRCAPRVPLTRLTSSTSPSTSRSLPSSVRYRPLSPSSRGPPVTAPIRRQRRPMPRPPAAAASLVLAASPSPSVPSHPLPVVAAGVPLMWSPAGEHEGSMGSHARGGSTSPAGVLFPPPNRGHHGSVSAALFLC